ncbi:hypothetical protein Afil01_33590 [Actinorhabdospora filicis]|uniref:Uncharacterized protein n=1 Tax=Actinorhabdospora filicis TaxID=1785913 RepID=A0A9W6SMC0_9ACTN|nr:hypothetical protein [Actinorhabdospora filicis]GLZ78552.1 hypothetical protein Afil01_33590 [Actinorhabdospora filicis]
MDRRDFDQWAVTTDRDAQRRLLETRPLTLRRLATQVHALGLRPDPAKGHGDKVMVTGVYGGAPVVIWQPGPHPENVYDRPLEAPPEVLADLMIKADELDTRALTRHVLDLGLTPPTEPAGYRGWEVVLAGTENDEDDYDMALWWSGPYCDHGCEEDQADTDYRVTTDTATNQQLLMGLVRAYSPETYAEELRAVGYTPPETAFDVKWVVRAEPDPWTRPPVHHWLEWRPISLFWPPFDQAAGS